MGKDVASALGYKNVRDAIKKHVDDEDKSSVAIHDGSQNRNMVIINESELYSLIMSSKLPSAKQFKKWITHEVLSTIRKHGVYMTACVVGGTGGIDIVLIVLDNVIYPLLGTNFGNQRNILRNY